MPGTPARGGGGASSRRAGSRARPRRPCREFVRSCSWVWSRHSCNSNPAQSARGVLQVIRGERPCKLYLDIESPIPPGTDHAAAVAENEARLDSLLEALRCFILARFSGEVCSPVQLVRERGTRRVHLVRGEGRDVST